VEFRTTVLARRMCRSFRPDPIDAAVVDDLLALANRAPSAGFSQGWAFLVLDTLDATRRFWSTTFPDGVPADFSWPDLFAAPVLIVPLAHAAAYSGRYAERDKLGALPTEDFWPVPYWQIDTGFAAMTILLAATDRDLGALFFGIFPEHLDAFREEFAVPEAFSPIGAIALGHPTGDDRPSHSAKRGRRPLEEVVHRNQFREDTPTEQNGAPVSE
jgi:nitroreductase